MAFGASCRGVQSRVQLLDVTLAWCRSANPLGFRLLTCSFSPPLQAPSRLCQLNMRDLSTACGTKCATFICASVGARCVPGRSSTRYPCSLHSSSRASCFSSPRTSRSQSASGCCRYLAKNAGSVPLVIRCIYVTWTRLLELGVSGGGGLRRAQKLQGCAQPDQIGAAWA
jgi:hypothetical protein